MTGDEVPGGEVVDLRTAILTGDDETSAGVWDCNFDDASTAEVETNSANTISFWATGRGISGTGLLYDWVISDEDTINGNYDSGDRTFVLESFEFTNDNASFTALNTSTTLIGSPDESERLFNATCNRM